ncbi:alpha/beta fold hydrolase [Flavobacteriales bacterium]|nr:alpha/beta fold hydrolase [Flavobacteriales bacterium]
MMFSRIYGKGQAVIIIHGLFGMSDNWNSIGKKISDNFNVHIIDLRNHGRSFHNNNFSYHDMSNDLQEYLFQHNIQKPILIGHSLGGKVAMDFCFKNAEKVKGLIVVDIAPKTYNVDFHNKLLNILNSLPISNYNSRDEIDKVLSKSITELSIRSFLMKSLYRDGDKSFNWRFNIEVLKKELSNIKNADFLNGELTLPTVFIKGGNSNYINSVDESLISKHFKNSRIREVVGAGHWVHAEKPNLFYDEVITFITQELGCPLQN